MHERLALMLMFTACTVSQPERSTDPATETSAASDTSIPVLGLELGLPERPSFVVPNPPAIADDGSWSIRGLRSVRDELLREAEQGRVVVVTAYVQEIYQPPTCLPNQNCLAGKMPHAWLVDDPSIEGKRLALMLVGTADIEVGRRYAFMGWFRRQSDSGFAHDQGLLELFAATTYPVVSDSQWVVPTGSERPELAHVPDSVRLVSNDIAADPVIEPTDTKHAYALGRDYDVAGQPLHADYYFRWMIVHSPDSSSGWVSLANSYADYGEGETGQRILELAIERRPEDAQLHNGLGRLLLNLERPQAASAAYRRAFELDPNQIDVLFGLGMAYAELGDRERAIETLERFLELAADAPEHIRAAARDTIMRMH